MSGKWRVGEHYGIHVYEGDRPVATFHRAEDATRCVDALAVLERVWELAPSAVKAAITDTKRLVDEESR